MPLEYGTSLEQLMNELTEDKLQQEPPRTVLEPEAEPVEAYEKEFDTNPLSLGADEVEEQPNIKDIPNSPELIVDVIDIFVATIAKAWTQTADKSKYRLEADEKDKLTKVWKMYLQNSKNVKMSPSAMLLLTTVIIYSPKAIQAFNERKELKRQKQWEE